ncbi:rho GTPase-activating protein 30 isoform X2 [Salarias fasciatus]|uniref:rho GTPase-activating protein 30 isoform X2 n=1 Tax=Salarias fasciatus TaxID=181472 RepID=UPI0011768C61|nr:rho GTPase-activating protein 30 isoform X2 [Salarias fasciatus]
MRRVRRKGGNKEKVFGCDLLEHLNASSQQIPQVLRCCSEFVEHNGIVDGIYRLSGVSSNIQKLRGEFESDGGPDLNKDVYLQDIHCVSSLCKAYFRELPNPLLTYQLYDKFAEAVAIQLEEERLVKIRDVLKELPEPHYRTLEFLMRHLVRMASFSSQTNMHSRNLAIVWAPNLLRSKDIEASGFNGTAAFMEVRVQSIVVEFILTHVPQLFPEQGVSNQRRKSLPSPSATPTQEGLFNPVPTPCAASFGNISPGDGPLAMRPYHAIIEGTDKRKGSLKGRKWMSIFNIGGRFHDQRRRHKHSAKEKERSALRPARSMDSLSTPSYPSEGARVPAQRPPSTHTPPAPAPTPPSGSDAAASTGTIGASEYAVTYRRGTGLVSGGGGTQGTYTPLDPEGLSGSEALQSRSPGVSTKVGRRAAMHITGPTMVTVPLHITSTLAVGVLKGGDRVIHRGRDKDGGQRAELKEGGAKVEKKQINEIQPKVEEGGKAEGKSDGHEEKNRREAVELERSAADQEDTDGTGVATEEDQDEEAPRNSEQGPVMSSESETAEPGEDSLSSNSEDDQDQNEEDADTNSDYIVMSAAERYHPEQRGDGWPEPPDLLSSTGLEEDDQALSGYVQDNFDFLDQMDCSGLEHMDCSAPYQVTEFSVEPPGHSDEEYEMMHPSSQQPGPETHTEPKPHRPLSLDLHSRHTKSLSLPQMVSPCHGPDEPSSEDDSDATESSFEDDEGMFVKSLPADYFLNSLSGFEQDADTEDSPVGGPARPLLVPSGPTESQSANRGLPVCIGGKDKDRPEEKATGKDEEDDQVYQEEPDNNAQSQTTEEDSKSVTDAGGAEPLSAETAPCGEDLPPPCGEDLPPPCGQDLPPPCGEDLPPPCDEDLPPPCGEDFPLPSGEDLPPPCGEDSVEENLHHGSTRAAEEGTSVTLTEHQSDVREDPPDRGGHQREDARHQFVPVSENNSENMCEEPVQRMSEADGAHGWDGAAVWDEREDAEVETEDRAEASGARAQETEQGRKNKTGRKKGGNPTEPEAQRDFVKQEADSAKRCEFEKGSQKETAISREVQDPSRGEVTKQPEKQNQAPPVPSGSGEKLKEARESAEGRRAGVSPSRAEGVGRKLVVTKHPRVYQVRAVPVVPPKPHHCRITALTLRQQERERKDADRGREKAGDAPADRDAAGEDDGADRREIRRRDVPDRNSPLSMCFDEAVAIATMRREKERREGEAEAEGK